MTYGLITETEKLKPKLPSRPHGPQSLDSMKWFMFHPFMQMSMAEVIVDQRRRKFETWTKCWTMWMSTNEFMLIGDQVDTRVCLTIHSFSDAPASWACDHAAGNFGWVSLVSASTVSLRCAERTKRRRPIQIASASSPFRFNWFVFIPVNSGRLF